MIKIYKHIWLTNIIMTVVEKIYYFHNKNNYINDFSSKHIYDVFHEILYNIDYTLNILLNSGVNINLNDLRFDHFTCLEVIENINKPTPFIINIYKFHFKEMAFIDIDEKPIYFISNNNNFNFILKSITDKISKLNQTKDQKQKYNKNVTNIKTKKNDSIKDLIKETTNILKNTSEKSIEPDIIRPMNSVLYEINNDTCSK